MSHSKRSRYAIRSLGLVLAASLGASVLTGSGTAVGADPTADCVAPFPVADLAVGDPVDGLTVTTGTTPQGFTGEVLGTLKDGIAPGVDMVLVKVDPAGLDVDPTEVKGIWQGMSGSPVYADDGRLIGAVAYGLSTQQSWVAGVTPFEAMDDYLGTEPAARHGLDRRTAARVAAAAGVTTAQAARGFEQLPMPLAVAGVSSRFLHPSAKTVAAHPWMRTDTYAVGRAGAAGPGAETMVAGGNMAAAMSTGDILMAGLGTATSVCDGDVVGFGHPMTFGGDSSFTLHPAEALYVQGDAPSFKVANIGDAVGTVFGDHMTGITGRFGAVPSSASVTSTVTWGSRSRTGTSYVSTGAPDDLAMVTYLQGSMNHARVIDGLSRGSEVFTLAVTGTDAAAKPFTLSWTDRYLAGYDLADEISMFSAELSSQIASIPDVTVDSISTTGAASADQTSYQVVRVEQRRAGAWVRMSPRKPAVVRAGSTLKVRAVLKGKKGVLTLPFSFAVPRKAAGQLAELGIAGGQSTSVNFGETIASAQKALKAAVRSDTVRAQFGRGANADVSDYGDEGDYEEFLRGAKGGGPRMVTFLKTTTTAPRAAVMGGSALVPVMIR
ncbi:hypothetical protein [Nocardioides conyzicola]|uniref:Peptidase S55 domain-containing protein n=1 Tax=Nocardioides conyzicola TaxID=1651781 RepID=A0ABP8XY61_9ACTN